MSLFQGQFPTSKDFYNYPLGLIIRDLSPFCVVNCCIFVMLVDLLFCTLSSHLNESIDFHFFFKRILVIFLGSDCEKDAIVSSFLEAKLFL